MSTIKEHADKLKADTSIQWPAELDPNEGWTEAVDAVTVKLSAPRYVTLVHDGPSYYASAIEAEAAAKAHVGEGYSWSRIQTTGTNSGDEAAMADRYDSADGERNATVFDTPIQVD